MRILGIETSCDETSAAIVEDGSRIHSLVTATQIDIHSAFGGVVPEVASRQHVAAITSVVRRAFQEAGMSWADIDAIAVTCGPGLLGALLVGVSSAKGYALASGLPLIGVHHIAGHVASVFLEEEGPGTQSVTVSEERLLEASQHSVHLPFLCLVVSGGHTEILHVDESFHFTKLGGTKDDAVGEAYDKVARLVGFAYPGGPKVDEAAARGNPGAFAFPRSLKDDETFDFSFSGLKSAVANELHKRRQRGESFVVEDVCASFQAAVIDVLVEKTVRAVSVYGLPRVVVAGGVAANRGLREALQTRGLRDGFSVHFPSLRLCGDNGAMIAAAGYLHYRAGHVSDLALNAYATLSLEKWQTERV